jgi:hypothetical protein
VSEAAFNLETLQKASETARGAIADKCIKGMVRPPEDDQVYAWGQYLEIRGQSVHLNLGQQYGIYGTSAGLQILTLQSAGSHRNIISRASRVLPFVVRDEDGVNRHLHEHFVEKCDLIITCKLASLLDVATILEPISKSISIIVDRTVVLEKLLEIRHSDAGWPDYKSEDEWQGPNTHSTAVALLATSRANLTIEAERACVEALSWFSDQPLQKQSVATLSMMVMAFSNFTQKPKPNSAFTTPRLKQLKDQCESFVYTWIKDSAPSEVQRSLEGTECFLPPGRGSVVTTGTSRFTFLAYLPHVLAALAILASPRLRKQYKCRQFVVATVRRVTHEINSQGCFIAAGRSVVSTVEHLWLYRLLHEYETQALYSGSFQVMIDDLRHYASQRKPLSVAAIFLTIGIIVTTPLATGRLESILTAVGAVALTIVATVVATILAKRWKGAE